LYARVAAIAAVLVVLLVGSGRAWAEDVDVVEGRLTLTASYGFLAAFYQDDQASGANPKWGHGVFLRFGGERCGAVCLGLSLQGSVGVDPSSSGSVGVGPHIGLRWEGPTWAGPYFFRFGVSYYWLFTPEPVFDEGQIEYGDGRAAHGVGGWLTLGLEILRGQRLFNPIFGIAGRYVAVVSTDPIEHNLSAQGILGFTIGRRMTFGESDELDVDPDRDDDRTVDDDDDDRFELDEEEERRLREAEEELRRDPSYQERQENRLRR
jgi:hypothetical protein